MKKNGFTLAELLGVVVLLAFLMLLAFPSVIKQLKTGEETIDGAVEQLIFSSAKSYVEAHKSDFPNVEDAIYCITLRTLVEGGEISESLLIDHKGNTLNLNKKVEVKIKDGKKSYKMNDQCTNS